LLGRKITDNIMSLYFR